MNESINVYRRKKDGKILVSPHFRTQIGYRTDFGGYTLLEPSSKMEELGAAVRAAYQSVFLFYEGKIQKKSGDDVSNALGKSYLSWAKVVRELSLVSVSLEQGIDIRITKMTRGKNNSYVNCVPPQEIRIAFDVGDEELGEAILKIMDVNE